MDPKSGKIFTASADLTIGVWDPATLLPHFLDGHVWHVQALDVVDGKVPLSSLPSFLALLVFLGSLVFLVFLVRYSNERRSTLPSLAPSFLFPPSLLPFSSFSSLHYLTRLHSWSAQPPTRRCACGTSPASAARTASPITSRTPWSPFRLINVRSSRDRMTRLSRSSILGNRSAEIECQIGTQFVEIRRRLARLGDLDLLRYVEL